MNRNRVVGRSDECAVNTLPSDKNKCSDVFLVVRVHFSGPMAFRLILKCIAFEFIRFSEARKKQTKNNRISYSHHFRIEFIRISCRFENKNQTKKHPKQ